MARDPYDDDEPTKPRGTSAGGISVTRDVGPLPVWGWAAVAVAAVLLWRKIGGGAKAQQAGAATGVTAPGYVPGGGGGVYLLPGPSTPNGTGQAPAPAPTPTYLPQYPNGGTGKAPTGQTCAPGYALIQGPSGYTCATGPEAIDLGRFIAALPK